MLLARELAVSVNTAASVAANTVKVLFIASESLKDKIREAEASRFFQLVNPFQRHHCCVGTERICQTCIRSRQVHNLLRTNLIFERRFDVGVNQELNARRKALASGV